MELTLSFLLAWKKFMKFTSLLKKLNNLLNGNVYSIKVIRFFPAPPPPPLKKKA